MKNVSEVLCGITSISQYLDEHTKSVDESILSSIGKNIKGNFQKVVVWLKNIVARVGHYWVTIDAEGNLEPVITPLTAAQAYLDGVINKVSTCVIPSKSISKLVGLKASVSDALKLYGSGNSLNYWKKSIKEGMFHAPDDVPSCVFENSGQISDLDGYINEVKLETTDPSAKYSRVDTPALVKRIQMAIKNRKLSRLLIWGAPGIGKTAVLNAVVKSINDPEYQLIVKTLSNETPENFTLPDYVELDGQKKATDIPKTWLPVYKPTGDPEKDSKLDEACGRGMLFVDELSRASAQVLNIMLPLINEGNFNGYKLGSGWTIICASNRMDDENTGQTNIGNALSNRFSQVYYEPTLNSWKEWAQTQGYISPLLLTWLSMGESDLGGSKYFYWDPNEEDDSDNETKLFCTPRSWTNAMELLCAYAETGSMEGFKIFDVPRDILALALNQCIPSQAIDSFLSFLEVISRVGNFDLAVKSIWSNGGKSININKKNLALVALPLAQLVCSAHSDSLPTEKEFKSLCRWVVDSGSEQLASYVLANFQNIFFSSIQDEAYRSVVFGVAEELPSLIKDSKGSGLDATKASLALKSLESKLKPFCEKWGITLKTIPDYMNNGFQDLIDKYGGVFADIENQLQDTGVSGGLG